MLLENQSNGGSFEAGWIDNGCYGGADYVDDDGGKGW